MSISATEVTLSERNWGEDIKFYDYNYNGTPKDFQDLMVAVSERRAVAVEGEVAPMATRIRNRNIWLDELGAALADLSRLQAAFKSDDDGDKQRDSMSENTAATIKKLTGNDPTRNEHKKWVEYYIQRIKTEIDGQNNHAQKDMSRLQQLVDRRDESYSTATNLMTAVSDTRSNLIRNL